MTKYAVILSIPNCHYEVLPYFINTLLKLETDAQVIVFLPLTMGTKVTKEENWLGFFEHIFQPQVEEGRLAFMDVLLLVPETLITFKQLKSCRHHYLALLVHQFQTYR